MTARRALALGVAVLAAAAVLPGSAPRAQGVPVIDGSNLAQNVEQLQAALRDAEAQLRQIEELRRQVELQVDQLTNLEGILGSVTGINDIARLYNDAKDLRDRAAKIVDLDGLVGRLSVGDFDAIRDKLLDGQVTVGELRAAEAFREIMANAGFTPETLEGMAASGEPAAERIATTAAANTVAIGASQMAYEEAAASLDRVDGLVDAIGAQETLKESVDLNTRMAAETNFMLGQMWRLNAAAGLAGAQSGLDLAAEQARTRAFFDYGTGPTIGEEIEE
jgi:type IV secretion system protein VirB5